MSGSRRALERSSHLAASAEAVWAGATHFDGINDEFRPLLRMTAPRGRRELSAEVVVPGERLFRSWLLVLGVVPVDYDDLTIAELGPGHRFLERSRMLSASEWVHERVVETTGPASCRITDRLSYEPRHRFFEPVLSRAVPLVFDHRHRRLRARYGEVGGTD